MPVFDFIRRTMPWTNPQSLTTREVYALTAYVFYLNGIIAEDAVMNQDTLPEVHMPNEDGFITIYPEKY